MKLTPDSNLSMTVFGYPCTLRCNLKLKRHSSNVVFEEFILIASPLIKNNKTSNNIRDNKTIKPPLINK